MPSTSAPSFSCTSAAGVFAPGSVTAGLEVEGIRIDDKGVMATTPHPAAFGNRLHNPFIVTDFAEQQIEIITPPYNTSDELYASALRLREIAIEEAAEKGEYIWPCSLPPALPEEGAIQIACYDDSAQGRAARSYRESLAARYGMRKQLYSGVHFNFSFSEELLGEFGGRNAAYLKVARNFMRYGWLIIYLTGATPQLRQDGPLPDAISLRNGSDGYHNKEIQHPSLGTVGGYCDDIESAIACGTLAEAKELYTPLRIKPFDVHDVTGSLRRDGIAYLEVRCLDINPYDIAGISASDLRLLEAFALWLLLVDEPEEPFEYDKYAANFLRVADNGLDPGCTIELAGAQLPLREAALVLLDALEVSAQTTQAGSAVLAGIEAARMRALDPTKSYAARVAGRCGEDDYETCMVTVAHEQTRRVLNHAWSTPGYEDWEMSTQLLVKAALKRGVRVKPLDRADNLIELTQGEHREFVQQATKTSADSYITPLLMNNKSVSKLLMAQSGVCVPQGDEFDKNSCTRALTPFVGRPCVIKPKDTNFGLGITVFSQGASLKHLEEAAQRALEESDRVLIEEYVAGREYRFLIIDGSCVAVLHRAPAHVVGDGHSTIRELVAKKNKHPYRSTGYRSPLINICLDEPELAQLVQAGLTPESVPAAGETVYLRANSNISTGGDSIDYTDLVAPFFKKVACRGAKAFGAVFCGIDLITPDVTDEHAPYAIIEANFNPAIHIHSFPAEGKRRNIADLVLDALGF